MKALLCLEFNRLKKYNRISSKMNTFGEIYYNDKVVKKWRGELYIQNGGMKYITGTRSETGFIIYTCASFVRIGLYYLPSF